MSVDIDPERVKVLIIERDIERRVRRRYEAALVCIAAGAADPVYEAGAALHAEDGPNGR